MKQNYSISNKLKHFLKSESILSRYNALPIDSILNESLLTNFSTLNLFLLVSIELSE